MQNPPNKWPATPAGRNGLYVAQSMREMLDQASYESFRVPTLNLISRAHELLRLCNQAKNERIPPRALTAPLDELLWSLRSDPVAPLLIPKETAHFTAHIKTLNLQNPADLQKIYRFVQILNDRLAPKYREKLINEILSSYNSDRKNYIRSLLHALFSQFIFEGWDERFLLYEVETRFFNDDIGKVEKRTFERFLRSFDPKPKSYKIWVPSQKATYDYFKNLGFGGLQTKRAADIPNHVIEAFQTKSIDFSLDYFLEFKIDRLDHFGAASVAFEVLELLTSLGSVQRFSIDFSWAKVAYVIQNSARSGIFVPEKEIQFQGDRVASAKTSAKRHKRYADAIIGRLDRASSSRTLQALKNVTLAQSSTKPENQLVLIWSGIESLLSDPPTAVSRIEAYSSSMTPCICLNYARQYTCAVHDSLQLSHPRALKRATEALNVSEILDRHTKFAYIVFDDDYREVLHQLFAAVADNPLATNRLWKLHQNFKDPDAYIRSLVAHEERVRWQLARIYRARNNLVHGGDPPRYLAPLVLNAYEYFKSTFITLTRRASSAEINIEMEYLVSSVIFDYDESKADLRNLQKQGDKYTKSAFLDHFKRR